MLWRKVGKVVSVVLLLGTLFYASTVRDFHVGFSAKYHSSLHTDQCDNHIHSTEKEADCLICGMDVHTLYDYTLTYYSYKVVFLPKVMASYKDNLIASTRWATHRLRGPPAVA